MGSRLVHGHVEFGLQNLGHNTSVTRQLNTDSSRHGVKRLAARQLVDVVEQVVASKVQPLPNVGERHYVFVSRS